VFGAQKLQKEKYMSGSKDNFDFKKDFKVKGAVTATKFIGDGTELTVNMEKGVESLPNALARKLDKSGGKIEGPLNIVGKVASGNVCKEAWAGNVISTSKRGYADMPDMTINVDTGACQLYILFVVSEAWLSSSTYAWYRLLVDNEEKAVTRNHFVSRHSSVVLHRICPVKAGKHVIKAQWYAEGGTAKSVRSRTLTVIEM
jgi:hypothetical protein